MEVRAALERPEVLAVLERPEALEAKVVLERPEVLAALERPEALEAKVARERLVAPAVSAAWAARVVNLWAAATTCDRSYPWARRTSSPRWLAAYLTQGRAKAR